MGGRDTARVSEQNVVARREGARPSLLVNVDVHRGRLESVELGAEGDDGVSGGEEVGIGDGHAESCFESQGVGGSGLLV